MPKSIYKIFFLYLPLLFLTSYLPAQLEEDITFYNSQDGTALKGTLQITQDNANRIVILVPGEGEHTRTHNTLLTDSLLQAGYAVFRYDDRGKGKSGGKFQNASTLDFARDLQGAISYFKSSEIYQAYEVLVIGFGEGGLMALLAASEGIAPDRMVLISTPAMRGDYVIFAQTENQLFEQWQLGETDSQDTRSHIIKINTILRKDLPANDARKQIQQYLKDNDLPKVADRFTSPHYRYYIDLDPTDILRTIRVPIHFLYGEADVFVQPKQNTNKIWKTGNASITYETVSELEHYLQSIGADPEAMDPRGIRRILRYFNQEAP